VKVLRKSAKVAFAVVLFAVFICGLVAFFYFFRVNSSSLGDGAFLREQLRDRAMVYLLANYTSTFSFMPDSVWSGGRVDYGGSDLENFLYQNGGWSVSIQNSNVPNPVYSILVNYSAGGLFFDWVGYWQNGVMTEESSSFVVGDYFLGGDQLRNLVMAYVDAYHSEVVPYTQSLTWIGENDTSAIGVGSQVYGFQSSGWNMTLQCFVSDSFDCEVSLVYRPEQYWNSGDVLISWQGTFASGVVVEKSYLFNP
jgi:hypothetical protein